MPKELRIAYLGGTMYRDGTPIFKFKFDNDKLVSSEMLTDNQTLLPFEIRRYGLSEWSIRTMFSMRITPPTRQGFDEMLAKTPIKYYHPERIIRWQKGRCAHDRYWLDCDDDKRCWDE